MKQKKIFLIVCIVALFNFSYSQKKMGVIFNINGPYRITRQAMSNTIEKSNVDKKDMFYGAYKFLETGKGNPTERIINAYLKNLDSLNVEIIQIKDTISKANDPIMVWTKPEYVNDDLKKIKTKYNLDYLLIVDGQFGIEFEKVGYINGDKRTNIFLSNAFINLETNEVVSNFNVGNISNVKKKNILSPPNFPNFEESMNNLLNDKVLPEIERKIKRKIVIP
ncbi:hypothetical protein EV143_10286 [Flavobacterium chryseum]|uniref:hypothetical protein n=1 Tax=Flavobacterium sp. P3160 TaxID=2512113 RepID=UPI00105FAC10|nr:hypothetical protein [Flavobacterium sp. P3160]TDO82826.1 hypothetical protein EV143_10286 [Flavobacterium sp. P3160]